MANLSGGILGRLGFGKSAGVPWWFWLIVLAWVAYSAREAGKAQERAKALTAQLTVLKSADSVKAAEVAQLVRKVDELRADADSARGKVTIIDRTQTLVIDSAIASLMPRLDSASKVLVAKITEGYEQRIKARDVQIASLERLTKSQDQVMQMQKALIRLNQDISRVTYEAWQNERKLSNPNLLKRVGDALPIALGIVLIIKG